jgi:3-deoxy-D-manno-octulosonic-acid transferase
MAYLLNVIYVLALVLASPWLICSAVRKGKYRDGWRAKLLGDIPVSVGRPISGMRLWFHAVSVGEVNLIATLLREIRLKHPHWECFVSTTTAAGFALARKKYSELSVFYAPLDFSWAVRRAMRRIRPTMLVLVELELWPNLIRAAKENGAKIAIVNGRLGDKSFRGYRRLRFLVSRVLRQVDLIAAQNDVYAGRFLALGSPAERVHITGSLKFDGATTDRNTVATTSLRRLAGFTDGDLIFLAGSTQAPEEALALDTFLSVKEEYPQLKLVIVPRHPHRFDEVATILERSGQAYQRRTHLAINPDSRSPRILLVDTVGELAAWWGTATIGFVGGSLGSRGGQNMIEPAAYGVATCFGPNTRNFRDIVQMLLAQDAAVVVKDGEELTRFVRRCLSDRAFAMGLGQRAQQLVCTQIGASASSMALIERLVEAPESLFRMQAA